MSTVPERLSGFADDLHRHAAVCGREETLPQIVLVTKTVAEPAIRTAYDKGYRLFGESRVQEFVAKRESLPGDIAWHFIGHLQTNKVKQVVGNAALIHSVGSLRLAEAIEAQAAKQGCVQPCLLECRVAQEATKSGFLPDTICDAARVIALMPHLSIRGLMTIASFVDDTAQVRREFRLLRELRDDIRDQGCAACTELSMGMSSDWRIALEEGATYLRVGSLIFGERT